MKKTARVIVTYKCSKNKIVPIFVEFCIKFSFYSTILVFFKSCIYMSKCYYLHIFKYQFSLYKIRLNNTKLATKLK